MKAEDKATEYNKKIAQKYKTKSLSKLPASVAKKSGELTQEAWNLRVRAERAAQPYRDKFNEMTKYGLKLDSEGIDDFNYDEYVIYL